MTDSAQISGYVFHQPQLLETALTHSSVNPHVAKNYERLEFLGDRVLGVAVAALLYKNFPAEPEGSLSQRLTALVCKETAAEVARKLNLGQLMRVADEEIRHNENVLCDVCEAVIGAICLDGGLDKAVAFVNYHWTELIDKKVAPPKDAKTTLQEFVHTLGLPAPQYVIVGREGPEHEPLFTVEVRVGEKYCAGGQGHGKKAAEFAAAASLLKRLGQ